MKLSGTDIGREGERGRKRYGIETYRKIQHVVKKIPKNKNSIDMLLSRRKMKETIPKKEDHNGDFKISRNLGN